MTLPKAELEASRRQHLDRHARIEVLIDRLHTIWHLCILNEPRGKFEEVAEGWAKELTTELEWLQRLYAEALASDGDVRHMLLPAPKPVTLPPSTDPDVQ